VNAVKRFGAFWYDFIVGDDWRVAVGVVAALAALYALAHNGVNAWWLLPVGIVAQLFASIRRAAGRP
jgi:hypothetical protein